MTPKAPIAEIELPAAPPREPAWTIWDILLIALVFSFTLYGAMSLGFWAAHGIPQLADSSRKALIFNPFFLVPVQFGAYLITFLFTRMLITLRAQNDFWQAVKWNPPQGHLAVTLAFSGA